jgi:hypothetical protein
MTRMACIGAQAVTPPVRTTVLPGVETLCRREGGSSLLRTFFCVRPLDSDNTQPVQLCLFEI